MNPTYFLKTGPLTGESETPSIDLYETATDVILKADLPGVNPETLRVTASDHQLSIEGVCRPRPVQGRYLQMERCHEEFSRSVALPVVIDPSHAVARYERGVLTITFPKIKDRRNSVISIPLTES